MIVLGGQTFWPPLTEQQNSLNPSQHCEPQSHAELPHPQIAPYAEPGFRARSMPAPTATALPTKAERLMKLRRESIDSKKPEARSTRVTLIRAR
jgi:hypothetical protein